MVVVYKQVHEIFEYSVHMTDEHSTLDNCWCYVYEHLVSNHKEQTTNQKQLCQTLNCRQSSSA